MTKETPVLAFSCEFCEIFKNKCFEKHLWAAASDTIIFTNFHGQYEGSATDLKQRRYRTEKRAWKYLED